MGEKNEGISGTEGFGEYLKRQREIRGFSLEEVAEQTKISLRALRALEAEDWEILPADVYVRGFVRCYAEVIGLDPNEALLRYEKAVAPYRRPKDNFTTETKYVEPKRRIPLSWILMAVVILVLLVGGYLFFKHSPKGSGELDFSTITTPPLKENSNSGFEGGFSLDSGGTGAEKPSKP